MTESNEPLSKNPDGMKAARVLAQYGDIPVAYAVFHVTLNDDATQVADTEYVFTNALYREWLGFGDVDIVGRSFMETVPDADSLWFPYCYRAVVQHEGSHDTVYSPEIDSWLAFNVEPSIVDGYCIFAFTKVNEEHRQQEIIEAQRDTSDVIIGITDALNDGLSYDEAMNGLLEAMSRVIHPERLYIFERWEHTSDNTFEWCAPGIEPEIELLQNLDNSEFATWDRMLATDPVVVIPDVSAYKGVDDRLYELLSMQNIDRLLAVPFYDHGKLIGYLGADNYALDERIDTHRLLETVASFVSARMVNRRLMDELEFVGTHDSLTGLLNRRGIDALIDEHIDEHEGDPFVFALIDVDDFKSINDLYGHMVGDEALRVFAQKLNQVFSEEAYIGRNGGDEALVMVFGDSARNIEALLSRFVEESFSFEMDGMCHLFTVSAGYAWCNGTHENLKSTYSQADAALYSVKYNGKSGYRGFSEGMDARYRLQLGFTARNIAENLPEACAVLQPGNAGILFANDVFVDLLGYENLHDLIASSHGTIAELIKPEDRAQALEEIASNGEQRKRIQLHMVAKDGAEKNVIYSGHLFDRGNGKPTIYAVFFELDS